MKKKKTAEQELQNLCYEIRERIDRWTDINEHGCNDPFWPDGCNMNLARNHIIYDKQIIAEICAGHSMRLPEEYYLPTPPEVNNYYMANLKQKERVQRIGHPEWITTKRNKYDSKQLSLFW